MLPHNIKETAKTTLPITRSELRQLLFWASIGVQSSQGGSYKEIIIPTIKEYAKLVKDNCYSKLKFKKGKYY